MMRALRSVVSAVVGGWLAATTAVAAFNVAPAAQASAPASIAGVPAVAAPALPALHSVRATRVVESRVDVALPVRGAELPDHRRSFEQRIAFIARAFVSAPPASGYDATAPPVLPG
jgi:hypothetical protein